MLYIFVINGRADRDSVATEVQRQIDGVGRGLDYQVYRTTGVGDGTRFVHVWCDLHPNVECCFVACGGTGMVNEVASGMAGFRKKYLGILAFGTTNDFTKNFPDRDFRSLRKLLGGERCQVDLLRVNDSYAINVINVGFDAVVAATANQRIEFGHPKNAYRWGIVRAILTARSNKIRIVDDGKRKNRRRLLMCPIGNGRWCGGEFLCSPYAEVDDGLIEVTVIRPMLLFTFMRILPRYRNGTFLGSRWIRRRIRYTRARHVEVLSRDLMDISLDGEILTGHNFRIDILPKEINLILPSYFSMKKRFEPIVDKCGEIIDYLMSSPDIPQDEALQFKIRLSIEEAVENVVRYAYAGGMGWIEVGTELDPEGVMLTIELKDAGVPFNPLEKADPDVTLSAEDREIGGLGIFLCKQLMDRIEYRYEDGCNVLTMSKIVG